MFAVCIFGMLLMVIVIAIVLSAKPPDESGTQKPIVQKQTEPYKPVIHRKPVITPKTKTISHTIIPTTQEDKILWDSELCSDLGKPKFIKK